MGIVIHAEHRFAARDRTVSASPPTTREERILALALKIRAEKGATK